MKKYYEQLKIIQNIDSIDRNNFIDYIHHQKSEVSSLLSISPEFWIILDYIIHLTRAILKKNKISAEIELKETIKPIFDKYNSKIEKILRKIPDNEFYFLKKDMKSFHHIVCHSINMIDKGLPHFIPSYLFIESIEKMTVLYPLHENCVDLGTLIRKDYPLLLARFISEDFTPELKEIINYLIWLRKVLPYATPEDRTYLRTKMITMLEKFISNEHRFKTDSDYSTKELVIELREVITASFIRENMISLLDKIKTPGVTVSISECLDTITLIFLETKTIPAEKTIVRDLEIVCEIIHALAVNCNPENQNKTLFETLVLAKAMKPYFLKVTRYLVENNTETEICRILEICDYKYSTFPSNVFADYFCDILEHSHKVVTSEKEQICSASNITVDTESVNLFKAKMKLNFSRN